MKIAGFSSSRRLFCSAFAAVCGTHGDRVDAAGHGDLRLAGSDLVGSDRDRLQAGRTEPVDSHAPGRNREFREHHRKAGEISVLLTGMTGRAYDHILHFIGRDTRISFQQGIDEVRQHVIGPRQVEAASE